MLAEAASYLAPELPSDSLAGKMAAIVWGSGNGLSCDLLLHLPCSIVNRRKSCTYEFFKKLQMHFFCNKTCVTSPERSENL